MRTSGYLPQPVDLMLQGPLCSIGQLGRVFEETNFTLSVGLALATTRGFGMLTAGGDSR